MKRLVLILLIILIPALQLAFVNYFSQNFFIINIPLFVVAYMTWARPSLPILLFSSVLGWEISYISTLPFGVDLLIFLTIGYFLYFVATHTFTNRSILSLMAMFFIALIAYDLLHMAATHYAQIKVTSFIFKGEIVDIAVRISCTMLLFLGCHVVIKRYASFPKITV